MFGILKKKLSKLVESVTKKTEEKEKLEEPVEKIEEQVEEKISAPEKEEIKIEVIPKLEEDKSEIIVEVPKKEKKSLFKRVAEKVTKTVLEKKLSEEDLDPILKNFETDLIESDVAVDVAEKITGDLKRDLSGAEVKRGKVKDVISDSLKKSLHEILDVDHVDLESAPKNKKPYLILFLGFNGSGKTTSLAKVAHWLIQKGHTCVFAAADTFRAAAEEQLEIHAKNLKVNLIKHKHGADPAAVIFDAVEHAKAKGIDFVLADTAGRAHTNRNLMDQMQKIVRVNKPDLKILVIDSLTGNDAVLQARMYNEVGVDAVIFTKVDVNEKGGAILSVTHELKKPILFLGSGQDYENFEKFDSEKFVNNLLL